MLEPTPFADLNAVLDELVTGVRGLLGRNLVGFYLQGSFALGAGDEYSDLDFVAVVRIDLSDEQIPALEAMHAAIYDSPSSWAQHLEGSYIPVGVLRNLAIAPTEVPGQPRPPDWTDPEVAGRTATVYPVWFLGNGERRLVRSEHDNSLVTRWVLREHGIALTGPPASEFIDPVSDDALRYEIREVMASLGGALRDGSVVLDQLWLQAFIVLLYARMLCTVATGDVRSKRDSVAWALANVAPEWHGMIERAWEVRAQQFRGAGAPERNSETLAEPREVARTLAFVRYASQEAGVR